MKNNLWNKLTSSVPNKKHTIKSISNENTNINKEDSIKSIVKYFCRLMFYFFSISAGLFILDKLTLLIDDKLHSIEELLIDIRGFNQYIEYLKVSSKEELEYWVNLKDSSYYKANQKEHILSRFDFVWEINQTTKVKGMFGFDHLRFEK